MTDSSDNSFNTNSYRKKASLDDIDKFVHDIQNDTDDIIRDFHSNKLVMKKYFNGIITKYSDMEESILLLIYSVLCMKTKLMVLDKKIEEYVKLSQINTQQTAGGLDEETLKTIAKELPLAFQNIYYQYGQYKMIQIMELLNNQSVTYLDQLTYPPVINNSREIVPYDTFNYFNSYCDFYTKTMTYIKDFSSMIEDQFREDNLSEIDRYYVYRRITEFDMRDEKYNKKNDTLRENINTYKTGGEILNMLYGTVLYDRLVPNIVNGLRTKITEDSQIIVNLKKTFQESKGKITSNKKEINNLSKTFDKLTNQVTNLLESKNTGGYFINIQPPEPSIEASIKIINQILYSCLRTADSIHDFFGNRTSPEFEKNKFEYIKYIKFITDIAEPEIKQNFEEILKKLTGTKVLGKRLIDQEDFKKYKGLDINIAELLNAIQKPSDIEDHTMDVMNKFLYRIAELNDSVKASIVKVYRPGNTILGEIAQNITTVCPDVLNTAKFVDRESLFNQEYLGLNKGNMKNIFKDDNKNLLFVIYDKNILELINKEKRIEIIKKVKEFLDKDSVALSIDFYAISKTFFEMFTADHDSEGKNVFVRPNRVLAEVWDPAPNKKLKHLENVMITQVLNTGSDLLDTKNNMPICNKDYKVTFEENPEHHLIVNTGITMKGGDLIDIETDVKSTRFSPEVFRISNLIVEANKDSDKICKLFYLKNSGDWGQVTSANQNKSFLLSEDRLCNYYSVMTNTSSIYTIKRGDIFITMLHKGNIKMSWNDIFESINSTLVNNKYYLFAKKIEIKFRIDDKSDYSIVYDLTHLAVTQTNDPVKFKPIENLKKIVLKDIKYNDKSSEIKEVIIIEETVSNDVALTIIEKLNDHSKQILDLHKSIFLWKTKEYQNYNESIYVEFFDTFYDQIIEDDDLKYTNCAEKMAACKEVPPIKANLQTKIDNYVKNKVINYVQDNILVIYLLSLLDSDKYKTIINKYWIDIYKTIEYKNNELKWKPSENLQIINNEYETLLQEKERNFFEIAELAGDTKALMENLVQFYLQEYKLYKMNMETKKDAKVYTYSTLYYMENYKYDIDSSKIKEGIITPNRIFISSLLMNGVWDVFGVNPFIYSLFTEYLKQNIDKIPSYESGSEKVISKLKKFYSYINETELNEYINTHPLDNKLKHLKTMLEFLQKEKAIYEYSDREIYQNTDVKFIQDYFDLLKVLNVYEFNLFYYLYSLVIPTDTKETIAFGGKDNTVEKADIILKFDLRITTGTDYGRVQTPEFKIYQPFIGEYLQLLKNITNIEHNTELNVLLTDASVKQYFDGIISNKANMNNIDSCIESYFTTLKSKSEWEYYTEIMNIIKLIGATDGILDKNKNYLRQSNNYKTTIAAFVYMLNKYLDEYDKIIEILEPLNKDQCCKITKDLLTKINEEIGILNASEIFNHLTGFIAKALEKPTLSEPSQLSGTDLEIKTVQFVTLYTVNNYSSTEEAAVEVVPEEKEVVAAPAVSKVLDAEAEAEDVVPAELEAVDDVKKKCISLGTTKKRFTKTQLLSKIVELVSVKYSMIDRKELERALNEKNHALLCSILQLPADSEASLKDAAVNEAELNKIFDLPKLGGNIDYNKECQIM